MNGSLDKTRVLYVPVEEVGNEGRLLSACRILISLRAYFLLLCISLEGLGTENVETKHINVDYIFRYKQSCFQFCKSFQIL